ncbi:hypothetical protein BGX21_007422 [Mortierella sp. AD011]|nr:hypothetical protein BGX21_007422 [Mortierella sp. AD011]
MEPIVRAESLSPPGAAAEAEEEEPVSDPETEEDSATDPETEEEVPANARAVGRSKPAPGSKVSGKRKERFNNEDIAIILTWFEGRSSGTSQEKKQRTLEYIG